MDTDGGRKMARPGSGGVEIFHLGLRQLIRGFTERSSFSDTIYLCESSCSPHRNLRLPLLRSERRRGLGRGGAPPHRNRRQELGPPSPRPSPRSCLTGRGRRTRFSYRRLRHELSQRLVAGGMGKGAEHPREGKDAEGEWRGWSRVGKFPPLTLIPSPR